MRGGLAGPTTFTLIGGAPHAANVTHPGAVKAEIVKFLRGLTGERRHVRGGRDWA